MLRAARDAVPQAEVRGCVPRAQCSFGIAGDGLLEIEKGEHVTAIAMDS